MPSSLKKVTFEQMFFENSQLSKYVQEYIDQNKSKIILQKPQLQVENQCTMTENKNEAYDQAAQTTVESKDQFVQHENFVKDQTNQTETDFKEQFMQTDNIPSPVKVLANSPILTTTADVFMPLEEKLQQKPNIISQELQIREPVEVIPIVEDVLLVEEEAPRPKPVTAKKKKVVKPKATKSTKATKAPVKRGPKKAVIKELSSEIVPETPLKRRSLLSVDVPVKKRKIELIAPKNAANTKSTFSKRGALAEKSKKMLK